MRLSPSGDIWIPGILQKERMTMELAVCNRSKCLECLKASVTNQSERSESCYSRMKKTVYGEAQNMRKRLKQKMKNITLLWKATQVVSLPGGLDLILLLIDCRESSNGCLYSCLMVFTNLTLAEGVQISPR